MAKSREKPKKPRLPTRVAGIRLPIAVRKGLVMRFLNSSAGQVLLAEALVLAAGVFGARRQNPSAATGVRQGRRVTVAEARARLSYASLKAMKSFRAALAESDRVIEGAAAEPVAESRKIAAPRGRTRRRATRTA